jgi:hypothetical protein
MLALATERISPDGLSWVNILEPLYQEQTVGLTTIEQRFLASS